MHALVVAFSDLSYDTNASKINGKMSRFEFYNAFLIVRENLYVVSRKKAFSFIAIENMSSQLSLIFFAICTEN